MSQPYLDKYTVTGQSRTRYPSPWFDLSSTYYPKKIKTMFKYCKTIFYKNSFINSVITKLTEYPITEVLYEKDMTEKNKDLYNEFFYSDIKLKTMLVEIGLDYFTYGNAFISLNFKFNRYFSCKKEGCGHSEPYDNVKFKWKNFEFHGECKKCKHYGAFKVSDRPLSGSPDFMNFVRWSPENIEIDYDPLTGESVYYYVLPAIVKKKILTGKKAYLKKIPKIFIESVKEKKLIELDKSNLYHFKRSTLAEEDMGFGKPVILPVMAEIWYLQTLKKGNEAIAAEHIVPFRTIFPAQHSGTDPFTSINLGKWSSRVQQEILKWKEDPNHIAIFPLPMGTTNFSGDAKMLTMTAELKFLEETILNGLGVPAEFIKGGTTWTGSSISLRILENHFLHYRSLLEDFINFFIIKKAKQHLKYPATKVKFKRLRMADDSEAKRLAMELEQTGVISKARLLDEFGVDFESEKENIERSRDFDIEQTVEMAKKNANAQVETMKIQAIGQVQIEAAVREEQAKQREKMFIPDLEEEMQNALPDENTDPHALIAKYTEEVLLMPIEDREAAVEELGKKMPYIAQLIMARLKERMIMDPVVQAEYMPEEEETGGGSTPAKKPAADKRPAPKKSGDV